METNQASLTAQLTAFTRAYHATNDEPKVFDDFLARKFFTDEQWQELCANVAALLAFVDPERATSCPDQAAALAWVVPNMMCSTLSRSRYAEECLESAVANGASQYVILGAGLDTFAFRRPELLAHLQVFEVDHPATQAQKQQQLREMGWEVPSQLHMVPTDFTEGSLASALHAAGYNLHKRTFFSCLGVILYLPRPAVFSTLQTIAAIAPAGSAIVFDYLDADAFAPGKTGKRTMMTRQIVQNVGEPWQTGLDPATLGEQLSGLGLVLVENLSPADIEEKYFRDRTDEYHATEHTHYALAMVDPHRR